jgi:hypothetical protein
MQRVNLEQHEAQRLADLAGSRSVISLGESCDTIVRFLPEPH